MNLFGGDKGLSFLTGLESSGDGMQSQKKRNKLQLLKRRREDRNTTSTVYQQLPITIADSPPQSSSRSPRPAVVVVECNEDSDAGISQHQQVFRCVRWIIHICDEGY